MITIGTVYWIGGRTFLPVVLGPKKITGLVVEPDGWHVVSLSNHAKLTQANYKGEPYPTRKMRGWLRRVKPATDGAKKLRKRLMEVTA